MWKLVGSKNYRNIARKVVGCLLLTHPGSLTAPRKKSRLHNPAETIESQRGSYVAWLEGRSIQQVWDTSPCLQPLSIREK